MPTRNRRDGMIGPGRGASTAPPRTLVVGDYAFSPTARLESLRQSRGLSPTVTIGGRTYREIDNGSANVLFPTMEQLRADADRVLVQQALDRASTMARTPIGTTLSGLVGALGGDTQLRDSAFELGGLLDSVGSGVGAGAGRIGRYSPSRPRPVVFRDNPRPKIRTRETNHLDQAGGVTATVTSEMLGAGSKPDRRIRPAGWQGHGTKFNESRGHLLAASLGGSGREKGNLVTLTQNSANAPQMSSFERQTAKRVRAGEVIEYTSTPLYSDGVLPPSAVLVTALGSRGGMSARLIRNPAGQRK